MSGIEVHVFDCTGKTITDFFRVMNLYQLSNNMRNPSSGKAAKEIDKSSSFSHVAVNDIKVKNVTSKNSRDSLLPFTHSDSSTTNG